jgi:hypothetical protein
MGRILMPPAYRTQEAEKGAPREGEDLHTDHTCPSHVTELRTLSAGRLEAEYPNKTKRERDTLHQAAVTAAAKRARTARVVGAGAKKTK